MLVIKLPATTIDEVTIPPIELHLEHSLVSLSKWEQIHEKPFFGKDPMDLQETVSYIEQMILDDEIPPEGWSDRLSSDHVISVLEYINSKHTATWFRDEPNAPGPREVITNELIYYWLIQFQIPFSPCETWHVNRLMTLIKICGLKQAKPRKMSRQAQAEHYRNLNEQRRAQLGTSG